MGTLNAEFGAIMEECLQPGRPMTIILYVDEVSPGNPLRPRSDRKFQAIYWFVLEWPTWLIPRTAIWPVFGIFKSCHIDKVPGGMSGLWCRVLDIFFGSARQHNFNVGVKIKSHGGRLLTYLGRYGGTLADEKALKELHDYKGAAGTIPCMDCPTLMNTRNHELLPPGAVGVHTTKLPAERHSDGSVWAIADMLKGLIAAGRSVKAPEQHHGLKHNPHGLLFREDMRAVHRPTLHYLRDWMHVAVGGGAANVELGLLFSELRARNVPLALLRDREIKVIALFL